MHLDFAELLRECVTVATRRGVQLHKESATKEALPNGNAPFVGDPSETLNSALRGNDINAATTALRKACKCFRIYGSSVALKA